MQGANQPFSGPPESTAAGSVGDARRPPRNALPVRSIAALAALLAAAVHAGPTSAQTRDTAFYPVSGRAPSPVLAPPLLFEKVYETAFAGRPIDDPLTGPDSTGQMTVRTRAGVFRVDAASGSGLPSPPPTPAPHAPADTSVPTLSAPRTPIGATAPADRSPRATRDERKTPSWLTRLGASASPRLLTWGPDDLVAVLRTDGTIEGREARRGHMLWRHVASHRLSSPALSLGAYLLVVADASSSLETLRWSDGSTAGFFKLASENASFASAPLRSGDLVLVLAVQTPLDETRLLGLRARPATAPAESPDATQPPPSPPARDTAGGAPPALPPLPPAVGPPPHG